MPCRSYLTLGPRHMSRVFVTFTFLNIVLSSWMIALFFKQQTLCEACKSSIHLVTCDISIQRELVRETLENSKNETLRFSY